VLLDSSGSEFGLDQRLTDYWSVTVVLALALDISSNFSNFPPSPKLLP
jgi:hypothetical protein